VAGQGAGIVIHTLRTYTQMDFTAELVETKQSKKALDNVYRVSFVTDNPMVMDLGKMPSDTAFEVSVAMGA